MSRAVNPLISLVRFWRARRPVLWSEVGWLSRNLAARLRTAHPAILIMSLPRSGSSWMGDVLGRAENALYLREPVTSAYRNSGGERTVFRVDAGKRTYIDAAQKAFGGLPAFPRDVVRYPAQWSLARRSERRLVIKEVNPLALDYYLEAFSPRVVFLVRHPAAVAASYSRLGWWSLPVDRFWLEQGRFQAAGLSFAQEQLTRYPDVRFVTYEALCLDPVGQFESLCRFCDLTWDDSLRQTVLENSAEGDASIHWTTKRQSRAMVDSWRRHVTGEPLAQLRRGFSETALPWYQSDDDW